MNDTPPPGTHKLSLEGATRCYITKCVLITLGLAVLVLLLFVTEAYRDMGYICENTLSRKGHHQWAAWLGGFTTRSWYQKSPLEQFLEIEAPHIIEYRWISYKGTGKNIFGLTHGVRAHGMPGNARKINHDDLKRWMELNDSQTIRDLYESLRSGDQEKIIQMIDRMHDDLIKDIVNTK